MPSAARESLLDLLAAAELWNAAALNTPVAVKATSAGEDYDVIRADLVNRVSEAFMDFVSQSGAVTKFRAAAGRALAEDVPAAFTRGYQDAGGDAPEDDDDAWVTAKQAEQVAFMADAFESLKDVRTNETATQDYIDGRAELWGGMLDGVYSEGKLRGGKNILLEFAGESGNESCDTCQELLGTQHTTKWVLAHDMIPHPGNKEFDCGGWKCEHFWKNAKTGERVTF